MKKQLIIVGMSLILIAVGLSGCTDTRSSDTDIFADDLVEIDEYIGKALGDINEYFFNYDLDNAWIYLSVFPITNLTITQMARAEDNINQTRLNIEDKYNEYQQLKEAAEIDKLNNEESDLVDEIEKKFNDYETSNSALDSCLNAMVTYRIFVNLVRERLLLFEDYDTKYTLMDSKVTIEEYEAAIVYVDEIITIYQQQKENSLERGSLGIVNYSTTIINSWDAYIEAWNLYKEYLELVIQDNWVDADAKYEEYLVKYDEALEQESGESDTQNEEDIQTWYLDNIGQHVELFEEYWLSL